MSDEFTPLPMPGYSSFSISRDGRMKGRSGKILTMVMSNGYKSVKLLDYGQMLHRLLALTFIPNPDPEKFKIVRHINGDKLDNRLENLEWSTQKEAVNQCGKVTSHEREVIQMENGEEFFRFSSVTEAAQLFEVSRAAISKACLGINKSCCGFTWKYADEAHEHKQPSAVDLRQGVRAYETDNYLVFPDGRVYNTTRKCYLKPVKKANGYVYVTFSLGNSKKNHDIHRIVADHFLADSKTTERKYVNHKNKIRHDNRVENLEWVTNAENMAHARNYKVSHTKSPSKEEDGSS